MTTRFNSFYFTDFDFEKEVECLEEASFLTKSRYARNLWNILRKSAKRRMRPSNYEDTTPITQWGYTDVFSRLTDMYNDPGKEKKPFYIKNLFQGQFNPKKDSHEVFGDVDKVIETSWYRTNKGGNIILYELVGPDEDGDIVSKFFVAIDGKGQKFFAVDKKRGGVGMLFKAWLTAQKTKKNIFPDQPVAADVKKASKLGQPQIQMVSISKDDYEKLAPATESVDEDSIIIEKSRAAKRKAKALKDKKAKAQADKAARDKAEVDKEWGTDEKPVTQKQPSEKKAMSDEEQTKGLEKDEKRPSTERKQGELEQKLRNQLEQKPLSIKPSKEIESGWTFDLKGDKDTVFLYKNKKGEYKIAWKGQNAGNLLQKLGYIEREDIKKLK